MVKADPRSSKSESQLAGKGSWSRSNSRTRKPLLPRTKSSQRLIRTISVEQKSEDASNALADELSSSLLQLSLGSDSHEFIEVPFVKATLDITLPMDYLKVDVLHMIQSLKIPKWCKASGKPLVTNPNELTLTMITGTMTNAIYKVERNKHTRLPSLLLRVYGPNVESIIDRAYELETLARLSFQNIGPSLFGCFNNGRFEQFLENSKTLTKDDIRDWKTAQRIARRMKEFHGGVPLLEWEKKHCIAWSRIDKWVSKMDSSEWIQNIDHLKGALLTSDWTHFKNIINKYRLWLDATGESSKPLVFCHNDTQYGNLLFTSPVITPTTSTPLAASSSATSLSDSLFLTESNISLEDIINPSVEDQKQDSKLVVIDFEYAGPNPAAYDLANFLSEWMSDYHCTDCYKTFEDKFPKREEILNFVYSYTSHLRNKQPPVEEEVRNLYNSIIRWRPCVSLHWSLWGLIQSGKLDSKPQTSTVVEEEGPGGEKYIITLEDKEPYDSDDLTYDEDVNPNNLKEATGADIHSFDYISYAKEKISVFYGDLVQLGVIEEADLPESTPLKKLDVKFL
ncbi:choline/ethanolamine kinase Ecym_4258 [Eremothecium cymbalariae DBVPG|uniref:Choline kinase N-terminal domain-containing protein n=1 Tax=Eremothecium cymbalariae (strain CBS 270.75 / DBVPG 7215 / KCTC 17166 / NRRL Y-17582) TaxID=931890 RepID=G8JTG9_ERECY|nr:hypothetical protein Ecym_4258 [Eremothecium cymbalariae DBVPG\